MRKLFILSLLTAWQISMYTCTIYAQTITNLTNFSTSGSYAGYVTAYNSSNKMQYFTATDEVYGIELWRSDGTVTGTFRLTNRDVGPDATLDPVPQNLTPVGNLLFFTAYTAASSYTLWVTDGTVAGTRMLTGISAGSGMTEYKGMLYFNGSNGGTSGSELWRSNGTLAGTTLVKDINPGSASSSPNCLVVLDEMLYFAATNSVSGRELWKSDGTVAGTLLFKDIRPGVSSSDPSGEEDDGDGNTFTKAGRLLYFSADNGTVGRELWKTDGTIAGTVLVKDIRVGSASSGCTAFRNYNGVLYFGANDGTSGSELWRSNGTLAGTTLVKDINPGSASCSPHKLLATSNGRFYFVANDGIHGKELWASNGTAALTYLVKDVWPGSNGIFSDELPYWNMAWAKPYIYFGEYTDDAGYELYRTTGTEAGTQLIDLQPGTAAGAPFNITAGNYLYLVGNYPYRNLLRVDNSGSPRLAATEAELEWRVSVLGNPVKEKQVTVEISGAGGENLSLTLMDEQGRIITHRQIEQADPVERQSIPVDTRPTGLLLLKVSTPSKSKTVKVLKD